MAVKGYQTYRGRTPRWKKILIAVLVVILLSAGCVLVLQAFPQVFDANGTHLRLPGGEEEQPQSSNEEAEDPGVDIVFDIQEPENGRQELHGRTFDAALLQGEDFSALGEGERPVLTVKAANGAVLYGSAEDAGAELVRGKIAGREAVARISCYADTQKAKEDRSLAVMSVSGSSWKDPDGNAWLDPYNADVTAYLVGIARDCAALGFSELVLDDVQFPSVGRTDRVTYPAGTDTPEKRAQAINAFLDAVNTALDGQSVAVAIALPAELIETGSDEMAGWDLAEIAQRVDRVYVEVTDQAQADRLRAALGALRPDVDAACFFVALTDAPITGGSYVLR